MHHQVSATNRHAKPQSSRASPRGDPGRAGPASRRATSCLERHKCARDVATAFRGRVAAIATKAEFTPRVALTEQERADLLFGVRIEFRDDTRRLHAGLPITVELPANRP